MATSAPSPLASSVEKTNGAKLTRLLIDGGTTGLRKIFDSHHPPANLAADLNANKSILSSLLKKMVLHKPQWDKLVPPGGVAPDSNTFDITLLYLLLTNICGLTPPPSGWHAKPPPSDTSHEANLARVKFYRNVLYGHVTTTGVDTPTFSALWTEISGVLVSLGLDQAEVDKLKAEKGGEQDYIDVLIEWADSEEDIKTQLENINQVQSKTRQAVEDVREAQFKTQKTVKDIHQTQASTQKTRFQEGTREWVFDRVQNWLDDRSSQNRVMVISGNAGMGKSVIAAVICKRMQEAGRLSGSHFCQYNNVRYCKPQLMIQSLACHFSHALPEYKQALVEQLSRNLGTDLNNMGVEELFAVLFKEPLNNQSILNTLLFLLRKNLRFHTDFPRRFLQTILNQGGKVLSVEASNLLQNKYPEIPYMEVFHKESQHGSVVAKFECSSAVICLDVSPQLDYMVCECMDGMLQLWSLQTGRLVWTRRVVVQKSFKWIGDSVLRNLPSVIGSSFFRSVVFHPTKECILPGILSQAYTVDGDLKPLFPGSNCRFSVCSISGDKAKILTNCLESSKCLAMWSLENGSEVDRILEDEDILSFAWSGDARLLVISHSSGVISLYDVMCNFRKLIQMATPEVCGMVKFSPDHRLIFCCAVKDFYQDSFLCLKVIKEASNTFSLTIVSGDSETFESCNDCGFLYGDLISTKGRQFGLTFGLDKQRQLRYVWNGIQILDTKYVNRNDQGVAAKATGIALSLDGQTVFVANFKSVTAYDVSSGKLKAEINCGLLLYRPLCPVSDGVLISTNESTVELWSGNLDKRIKRWTNLPGVKQVIPISEERVAVDVKVLDTISGNVVSTIPVLQGEVLTCNSKCQLLIQRILEKTYFVLPSCSLQLLDGKTVVWRKKGINMYRNDKAVAFSPMEQFLVVRTTDGISVLDPETGNTLRTLGRSIFSFSLHCTFISDNTCVISDYDSTVQLLNVKSGELLTKIDVESRVICLAACPFNRLLAIGLEDSTPNFKVIRVHFPRGEDRGYWKR
ncbi:unnamed protein product [Porites lobata]|uniref:E3 ubiquitin-protein ligase DZIP3 n=1 Tax=Porites lobata TaxID=104759 RepID=A0ABN8S7H3_9CNID|nr:unnamed protein product [Porites lobata]